MKIIEAFLLVIVMTFVGFYSSFYIIKEAYFNDSDKIMLFKTKPINLFESFKGKQYSKDRLDSFINSYSDGMTNGLLYNSSFDKYVLLTTFIFFVSSLFFAFRVANRKENVFILWFLLIGLFFLVKNTLPIFPF
tara:strand:- start:82 stop:483 length:402 start_codon:yes stop_codon:yes gene_type:complete